MSKEKMIIKEVVGIYSCWGSYNLNCNFEIK